MQDVRIKNGTERFKFRVAGVVENNGKVLIVQMNKNDFYCFPGGHVELFEDTITAVKRELDEELYFEVEVKNLIAVSENFYTLRGDNFHELCFYYFALPKNKEIDMQDKIIEEQDKFGLVTHRYKWVEKNELVNLNVKPKQVIQYVLNNKEIGHIITKE